MSKKPKPEPKRKPGRPRLQISEKSVEELAALGCNPEEIAGVLGCCRDTIDDRFSEQVARGRMRLAKQLRHRQIDLAMKGSVPLLIWLGKQYLGQKEKSEAVVREEIVTIEEIAPKVQHDA